MRFFSIFALAVAAAFAANEAHACSKFGFETAEQGAKRCAIEASMPFDVSVRRFEKGYMAFLSEKRKAPRDSYSRSGVIVMNDGSPMVSQKLANRALRNVIPKAKGCVLSAQAFQPGVSFTYEMTCPNTPPAL